MELEYCLSFLLEDDYLFDGPECVGHGEEVVLSDVAGEVPEVNDFGWLGVGEVSVFVGVLEFIIFNGLRLSCC